MSKYIDAEKLLAEIERRKKQDVTFRERNILIDIEMAIAALQQEQPKVELEEEIENQIHNVFYDLDGIAIMGTSEYASVEDMENIACHFYELGLNARKEE